MSRKQIFMVWSCDDWQSRDSMRLLMATTSTRKLRSFIAAKIKDDTFGYDDDDISKKHQVERFKFDFDSGQQVTINGRLNGGCYDYCYDGEEV